MPQDIDYDPNNTGNDLRIAGNVDASNVRTRSSQLYGVNINGLFERVETIFSGVVNGFRVGKLAIGSLSWSSAFSGMLSSLSDIQDYLAALRADISRLENPLDKLSVLYNAYNYAALAVQTYQVNPPQAHLAGPALFVNETAQRANGTYDFPIPCLGYSFPGVQITWTTNGTRTFQWEIFGKQDAAAWPAVGAARAPYNISSWFQNTPGGIGFGGVGINAGTLDARVVDRLPFRDLLIQATVTLTDGNDTTLEGWYDLFGGAR